MKRLITFFTAFFAVACTTIVSSPKACAQIAAARVTIPFDFSANHQVLPAGRYTVELQSDSYVVLIDCSTRRVAGMLVSTTPIAKSDVEDRAVFQKVAEGMRLTQLRFANLQTQLSVQPKPGQEIAGTGTKVEIAMK